MSGKKRTAGALAALEAMRSVAKGWAEGAAENEEATGYLGCKPPEEQTFTLADILSMVNDAARKVGVVEPEPARAPQRTFTVQVTSPLGISETVSLVEGDSLTLELKGVVVGVGDGGGGWTHIDIPASIIIR